MKKKNVVILSWIDMMHENLHSSMVV